MPTTPPVNRAQRLAYGVCWLACKIVQVQCVRLHVLRPPPEVAGGYQLAITHLAHHEPVAVGLIVRRYVRWMTRIEFYRRPVQRTVLRATGAFPVNRAGVPVRSVRTAIDEARRGGIVGLFPEGGVRIGQDAVIRGGAIKRGTCLIAQHSQRPVVPVVVLGTDRLLRPAAYIPLRISQVWLAFGDPIYPGPLPPRGPARRGDREPFAGRVEAACRELYQQLLTAYDLDDERFP